MCLFSKFIIHPYPVFSVIRLIFCLLSLYKKVSPISLFLRSLVLFHSVCLFSVDILLLFFKSASRILPLFAYLSVFLSLWFDLPCFYSQHNNKSTAHFIQSKNHSTNLLTFFRKMHSKRSQRGFKCYTYPLLAVHCQNNSNFILSCGLNIFITICVGDEFTTPLVLF
jgi:hypothetical protein